MARIRVHPVIEAVRREALRRIGASRPRWSAELGAYLCTRCGTNGDEGFAVWHWCDDTLEAGA